MKRYLSSLLNNKKLIVIITVVTITEITYNLYKKYFCKQVNHHKILFFSATLNNNWRYHIKKECDKEECFCHNFYIIKNHIQNVKRTLDVCLYLITSQDLAEAIIDANNRGVRVRIITDYEMSYSSGSKMNLFKSHGISIRLKKTNNLMHHKFCIFDAEESCSVLMTGSLNLTMQAVAGNWDNVMFTSEPVLVKSFYEEFNRIWKEFDRQ